MEVYLIRHGIAAERTEYEDDTVRPLTTEGRKKTEKVAKRFLEMGLSFDLILTSPLLRSLSTAEIMQKVGLSSRVEKFAPLAPDGSLQAWIHWWVSSGYNRKGSKLALVGHQPDLGNWAETLVWGSSTEKLVVKKAGAIGLILPESGTPVGNTKLFLLTSPKWVL